LDWLWEHNTLVFHVRDGKVTEVWQYWADPYAADELFG
jgi:ketosteroid isomerase-like protein